MSPEDDQPTVDSALNGDEPTPAQTTSLEAEPNGSSDKPSSTEPAEPEGPADPEPEAQADSEPEAQADPEPEAEAPAAEEAPSPIAAEFERALQEAADAPAEPEPAPAEESAPEPEPAPEPEAPAAEAAPVVEAAVPMVEPSSNGDAAVAEADGEAAEEEEEDPAIARAFMPGDWFVVHTYAGYENKVKTNLESRISSMNVEEKIFEVVIPMEDVMEIKSGKKQVVQRKVFPGYLLVRMDLDDDSWYVVRNTPGVTGFVGSGARPIPLSEREVDRILQRKPVGERPKPKLEWSVNDPVRVTTGPFANFQGLISEIDTDRSKLKVLVNIFGRETPVELGFDQVAKV
jgi:transcription termination/antitermination protein NusG